MHRYFWVGLILGLLVLGAAVQLWALARPADAPIPQGQAIQTARDYVGRRLQRLGTQVDVTRAEAELGWAPEAVFDPLAQRAGTATAQRRCWIVKLFYKGLTPDAHLVVYVDANTGEPGGGIQTR